MRHCACTGCMYSISVPESSFSLTNFGKTRDSISFFVSTCLLPESLVFRPLVKGNETVFTSIVFNRSHSRPLRPRSFCSAPRITSSSGWFQHRKCASHRLPITAFSQSQVWQIWFVPVSFHCVCKANQNPNLTGPVKRSRYLVLTKRSAASGGENKPWRNIWLSKSTSMFCNGPFSGILRIPLDTISFNIV